jgi:hypothetical protein
VRRIRDGAYGPRPDEQVGVVSNYQPITTYNNVNVLWEDGHERGVFPQNIEVIPEPVLEPMPAPVDSELRERLIVLLSKTAPNTEPHENIIEMARAFESYIQGDTK